MTIDLTLLSNNSITGKHFAIIPEPIWGHVRPSLGAIPNILSRAPTALITILVPVIFAEQATKELGRYELHEKQVTRIKVFHYGTMNMKKGAALTEAEMPALLVEAAREINEIYPKLLLCQPILDTLLGENVDTHPNVPDVILMDVVISPFTVLACEKHHETTGIKPSLALWLTTASCHTAWASISPKDSMIPSYRARALKVIAAASEDKQKVYDQVFGANEDIFQVPDCAPIYVFESQPNKRDAYIEIIPAMLNLIPRTTALVHLWPVFLGQEYTEEAKKVGHNVLHLGPQLPRATDKETTLPDGELKSFLDDALEGKGKNSVVYISFGTILFPATETQISILVDVLISLDIPFVLAQGIASPSIVQMVESKLSAQGARSNGIVVPWAPQYPLLAHPATGWFLTHGGSNSAMESMRLRVPMLFWPCDVDQIWIANSLSSIHEAGYEFIQIRNGPNIGRNTYRGVRVEGSNKAIEQEFRDVFGRLEGEFGQKMRKNVESLGDRMDDDALTEQDWAKFLEL